MEKFLRRQGFNGNPYKPYLGDLKEYGKALQEEHSKPISLSDDIVPRVIPFLIQTFQKYGKNSFMWSGPTPSVLISEPELVKEILTKYTVFQKPDTTALAKLLAVGLASYEGEKWLKHRQIISPAFHTEKLKNKLPAFRVSVKEMLKKWEEMILPEGRELDVWPYLQDLTSDAISRTAFGSNHEEGKRIFELQRELVDHVVTLARAMVYIPGYRFLPTKRNRRMHYIKRVLEDSIRGIIEKRIEGMKSNGEVVYDDLLGILLESNNKEIQSGGHNKFGMSIKEVIEECQLFYIAGESTTSALLVWTLILLSKYQQWQTRAREEVLQVFGRNEPHFEGLNHLKIVTMILKETLRLYPPIATVARMVKEETKLGKYTLPAGTRITLPFILLHHDTEIWGEDAKEFNPERFGDGVSGATTGRPAVAFLPFSWGPRICIGQNFGIVEVKLAMAMVLQRFSFELSGSYAHAPTAVATIYPQHGAHLVLHKLYV